MNITTKSPASSRSKSSTISEKRRAGFARGAVFSEFRARDARALDYDGFTDRDPENAAKPISEVGCERILHWLKVAANSEAEDAESAFQVANELRAELGLEWTDLIGQEAA